MCRCVVIDGHHLCFGGVDVEASLLSILGKSNELSVPVCEMFGPLHCCFKNRRTICACDLDLFMELLSF